MKTKLQFPRVALLVALLTTLNLPLAVGQTTNATPFGPSLSFDGVDDYVQVTGGVALANSSFTIETWVNRSTTGTEEFFLGQGTATANQGLHFGFRSNNRFTFGFWSNDLDTDPDVDINNWHHWAGTYDATTRVRCIYRDGVLVASVTASSNYVGSGYLRIGGIPQGTQYSFQGLLDEVRIWNVVRTPAQIQAQMLQPLAVTETGLLAYYRFDENTGTIASNSATTGAALNGTLYGPTWSTSSVFNAKAFTLPATVWSSTAAILNGYVNPKGVATTAWFEWGATTNYGTRTLATNLISGVNPVQLACDLMGLSSGATYHYRMVATDSTSTNFGADVAFTLVANLVTWPAAILSSSSVNFYGSVNPKGIPTTAWFEWGTTTGYGSATAVVNIGNVIADVMISAQLSGLASGLTYHYRVAASNRLGMAYGPDQSFVQEWPPQPRDALLGWSGGATMSWAASVGWTLGWLFQANQNISVTALGVYDLNTAWQHSHQVGIWSQSGTLLATATVTSADPLISQVRWVSLVSPVQLDAGGFYLIGAHYPGSATDRFRYTATSVTMAPAVTYLRSAMSGDTTFSFPSGENAYNDAFFGPNFRFLYTEEVHPPTNEMTAITLPATGLSSTTATLNGSVNPGGLATTAWFEWGTSTSYGNSTTATNVGSGTTVVQLSANITVLSPGNTYHYRAVARNSSSTNYGADVVFITQTTNASPFGNSLYFDGADYILVTGQVALANSSITLEAWASRETTGTYDLILGQGIGAYNQGLQFGFRDNNTFTFAFWGDDLDTVSDLDINKWHHWAGTFDVSTKVQSIYHDGVLVATRTASSNYTGVGGLRIGDIFPSSGAMFRGLIDEVRVWNVARTAAQIQTYMFRPLAGTETGLLAYYRLDESSGTIAYNSSTAGAVLNGTLYGPTWNSSSVAIANVATLPARVLSSSVAELNGYANPNGFVTTAWFEWGATTSYGSTTTATNLGSSTYGVSYNFDVTGLSPGSTYHYRVLARTSTSTNYGADVAFTTQATNAAPFGYYVWCDGQNGYVLVTNAPPLANTSFTIEVWANRDSAGAYDLILGQGTTATRQGLHFGFRDNDKFTLAFYSDDLDAPTDSDTNKWHHWAGTYDANTRLRCLYRDGALVASGTASAGYTGTGQLWIGSSFQGPSYSFKGLLDEVRIWNVVRTAGEILANMNVPLIGTESGLVAYWPFNEGSGTTTADVSGHGHTATLMQGTAWYPSNTTALVTTLPATVLSSNAATLNGSVNPAGLATTAWFEWGATTSYGASTTATNMGSGTNTVSLSFALTGLTPGSTYHYRVVARTSSSTNYGGDVAFTTTTATNVLTVTTLPATILSSNSATLNGSVNPGGLATTAWFEWGTTTSYGNSTATTNVGSGTAAVQISANLTGLSPGVTYHYRVRARNSSNTNSGADMAFSMVAGSCELFRPVVTYPVGANPRCVAGGDFNGDNHLDLVVGNSMLLGNGDGSFQTASSYVTGGSPYHVAAGDFNNDGRVDLALANGSSTISVLRGNGNGTFQTPVNYTVGATAYFVAVGDLNRDSRLDLVVANYGSSNVSVLRGNGDGTFQTALNYAVGKGPKSLALADFNGDGNPDLAVANESWPDASGTVSVLRGNGDGTFQAAVNYAVALNPDCVGAGDFNGDGHPDFAVGYGSSVAVFLGNGDGTFRAATIFGVGPNNPTSIVIGDFNADGKSDLAFGGMGKLSLLLGNGNGAFQTATVFDVGLWPEAVATGDFNGDSRADLALANQDSPGSVAVLLGNPCIVPNTAPVARCKNVVVTGTNCTAFASIDDSSYDPDGDLIALYQNPNGPYPRGDTLVTLTVFDNKGASASCQAVVTVICQTTNTLDLFQPASYYTVGTDPECVAVGDFNGDGKSDVAVVNSGSDSVSILLGNGDGTFKSAVNYYVYGPDSVAVADFNSDGRPDLVTGNWANISVLIGNGDGTFKPAVNYAAGTYPWYVGVGDFNGDARIDLCVANVYSGTISVLLGNGNGAFQTAVTYPVGSSTNSYLDAVGVGDFNGDNRIDIAVANWRTQNISVLLGNGNGTFQAAVNYSVPMNPWNLTVGDFNADNHPDLVAVGGGRAYILLGNGNGTFQAAVGYATGSNPQSVAVGDFNCDGRLDLAVGNVDSDNVSILRGNGNGTFQAPTNFAVGKNPYGVAVGDLNGDGTPDVVAANLGSDNIAVLLAKSCTPPNRAPVAICRNVVFGAGTNCSTSASIDNGSYDPDGDLITLTQSPAGPYPLGATTVTLIVTDSHGSSNFCQAVVTVTDTNPPVINCPTAIVRATDPGKCYATITVTPATATDNCGATVTGVRSDGQALNATYPKGVTTITWMARDAASNAASCTQTITVNDAVPPAITCPAAIVRTTDAGQCYATVTVTPATFTDNCGATVTGVRSDGQSLNAPFPKGLTAITWTARDGGNSATCTQTITVNDTEPPVIICPTAIVQATDAGQSCATVTVTPATATDNCGATVIGVRSDSQALNATYPKGVTTITWTARDGASNSASCTQTITVNDTELPVITCPAGIVQATDAGQCYAIVTVTPATATDNCGATVTGVRGDSQALNATYPKGVTTINWTARDGASNAASCTQTITVNDTEPPQLQCPTNLVAATDAGQCSKSNVTWVVTATDNCAVTNLACTPPSGSTFTVGTQPVVCSATDASGNTSSCTFTVTVQDIEPPAITCPEDLTVEAQELTGAPVCFDVTAFDQCNDVSIVVTPPSGSTFPIGCSTVTCIATDAAGNTNAYNFQVTVLGSQGIKQNLLAELIALRAANPQKPDTDKLGEAIEHLTKALEPGLWLDPMHLQLKHGQTVFQQVKDATHKLEDLMEDGHSQIADTVLQGFIERMVNADRLLALEGIEAAKLAGARQKKLDEAAKELAKAAEELALGHFSQAIEHYRHAWKNATHGKVTDFKQLPDGTVQLEFVGDPGVRYQIAVSTNLVEWVVIATVTADADGVLTFADPKAKHEGNRYYSISPVP